ncbi:hypothetical protein ACWC5I_00110 [Kitasatospora sp. NPDC001574]
MTDQTPRVVRVQVVPAAGFILEIEGTTQTPVISVDDAKRHLAEVLRDEVQEVLGITKEVPLTLFVELPPELT